MKRILSFLLVCLLSLCPLMALADSPSSIAWAVTPAKGDTSVSFTIGSLGNFFYHVWIVRDGNTLGYFNSNGDKVPFTSNSNSFDLLNDTDIFVNNGFAALEPGDEIKVRVGDSSSTIAQTIAQPAPDPTKAPVSEPEYIPVETVEVHERAVVEGIKESANVRSGPGTDTEVIGQVKAGETIELLQWNEGETWCKICYNGGNSIGWLYHEFIRPVK